MSFLLANTPNGHHKELFAKSGDLSIKAFIKVYNEVVPTCKRLTKRDQKEKNEEYIEGIRLFCIIILGFTEQSYYFFRKNK